MPSTVSNKAKSNVWFVPQRWWLASSMAIVVAPQTGCTCSDPEAEIRSILDAAADASEARDIARISVLLSDDYKDPLGRDKREVERILQGHFDHAPLVTVAGRKAQVEVDDEQAHATYTVVLARGNKKGMKLKDILPESFGAYKFTVELVQEGDVWRIRSATHQPASPFELFR